MNIEILKKTFTKAELLTGEFGLEREGLRITADGKLALTPHPEIFGDKLKNVYITTDFSESQVEVVTPAYASVPRTHKVLEGLCDIVNNEIGDEYFWPQSMPCDIPDDKDIPIARYEGEAGKASMAYRRGLVERYGGKKQLISGIHCNFSFTERFIKKLHQAARPEMSFKDFKDQMYLKMVRNYLRCRFMIIYLMGCTPALHKSYIPNCVQWLEDVGNDSYVSVDGVSIRNSSCGYKNKEPLFPRYDSIAHFTEDVRRFVAEGKLSAPKELYTQIRLKAKGVDNILESLEEDGIKYLELRTIDINPFDKCGLAEIDLSFLHHFMLYMLIRKESDYPDWQQEAMENEERVAVHGRGRELTLLKDGKEIRFRDWAGEILAEMEEVNRQLNLGYEAGLIEMAKRVDDPKNTYASRLAALVKEKGYIQAHLDIAKGYKAESHDTRYLLRGFEGYELSTQILIKEAITRGVPVEEVDPMDNFIGLGKGDKKTYVKQATKTARDNYISVLAMENKVVTKKLLAQKGIPVPAGVEFTTPEQGQIFAEDYAGRPVVIKPKSTNFGLGISIFEKGGSAQDLMAAIDIAFGYDNTVLMEDYIKGQEYRFLVIDGVVEAVLKRVPANVTGDGKSTISELVEEKNKHPFRGVGYTAPLKKIVIDGQTELYLKQQGLTPESVIQADQTVYLRGNSNISTGGDSIDMTDVMPDCFKQVAVKAAAAADAVFCGVDLLIEDYTDENSSYGIIELNFNPSTDMHAYPYKGKERRTGEMILRALGFIEER
ncbi:MAG: bifunctional glutamate--cysteine ligase GshA/glutathione synthetase GshB [Eubacterium sp.]|nr:bifunctional glutamate--cysteine ligase GshA/glutathione synthetase GshB [Eubacterium sp.]